MVKEVEDLRGSFGSTMEPAERASRLQMLEEWCFAPHNVREIKEGRALLDTLLLGEFEACEGAWDVLSGRTDTLWSALISASEYALLDVQFQETQRRRGFSVYCPYDPFATAIATYLCTNHSRRAALLSDYVVRLPSDGPPLYSERGQLGIAKVFLMALTFLENDRLEEVRQLFSIHSAAPLQSIIERWGDEDFQRNSPKVLLEWRLAELARSKRSFYHSEYEVSQTNLVPIEYYSFNAVRLRQGRPALLLPEHPFLVDNICHVPPPASLPCTRGHLHNRIVETYMPGFDEEAEGRLVRSRPFEIPVRPTPDEFLVSPQKLKKLVLKKTFFDDVGEEYEVPTLFEFDWRESEESAVAQLDEAGISPTISFSSVEGSNQREFVVNIGNRVDRILLPAPSDGRMGGYAHDVLYSIAQLLQPDYEIRQFRESLGSDTAASLLMPSQWWRELDQESGEKVAKVFVPIVTMEDTMSYTPPKKKSKKT